MIRKTFIVEKHEEYGTWGLKPEDMPHADPLMGMAAAHDILEHFPGDDGGVEAEYMAFGAMILTRAEGGYWQRKGNVNPPESHLASDMPELFRHFQFEGFTFRDPGRTRPVQEDAEQTIQDAVREGCKLIREEFCDSDSCCGECSDLDHGCDGECDCHDTANSARMFTSDQTRERMVGWMRRGYRKACRRFKGISPWTLAETFIAIEEGCDKILREVEGNDFGTGERITVSVDVSRYDVKIKRTAECGGCGGEVDAEDYYCENCNG